MAIRKSPAAALTNLGSPVAVSVPTSFSVTPFANVQPITLTLPAVDDAGWHPQTMQFFVVPPVCERPLIPVVSPDSAQLQTVQL